MDTALSTLTDAKLQQMIADCDRRRDKLMTQDGQDAACQEMIRLFEYLEACGYKLNLRENRQTMARVWVDQLADCIETYGFHVLRQAVKEFAATDIREFKAAPTPMEIRDVAKRQGFNPKRELALRAQAIQEEKRIAEANRKANEWASKQDPERLEELKSRWANAFKEENE